MLTESLNNCVHTHIHIHTYVKKRINSILIEHKCITCRNIKFRDLCFYSYSFITFMQEILCFSPSVFIIEKLIFFSTKIFAKHFLNMEAILHSLIFFMVAIFPKSKDMKIIIDSIMGKKKF